MGLRLDTEAGARILVRSSTQDSFAFAGWEVENEAALKGICSRLKLRVHNRRTDPTWPPSVAWWTW
ncbi:hypothetical protein JWS13_03775 (plasmid) [Rhodococcus pseudokoreensis]|uniref:Uncharacterized protein n=1 Tax=Rhodococcus pseudokoreensis TaxID=2811421 RepID=A0A974VYY7_9NOCA|nr:hypothetical protein [Rhodococcus pseudokoreensis]QSE87796.1 hypothetical protein JWS13_03775 [Rhodococcus pseudokoreensis]